MLKRDHGQTLSESTVGRILGKLVRLGKVKPVRFYYAEVKAKHRRAFNRHAKRWRKGLKARQPGQLIQIDHMGVALGAANSIKHFKAKCPITKITVAQSYTKATSGCAKLF